MTTYLHIFRQNITHKASIRRLPRPQISLEIRKKLYNEFHIDIHINDEDSVVYVFFIS